MKQTGSSMQKFVYRHFLSGKENLRFALFVLAAFILLVIGSINKEKPIQILPAQNQLIDSKPKHSGLPHIHRPAAPKAGVEQI